MMYKNPRKYKSAESRWDVQKMSRVVKLDYMYRLEVIGVWKTETQ